MQALASQNWFADVCHFNLQKGFVEAHVDDGLLEIFGIKQGWHTSFVMVDLITAVHIAQVPINIKVHYEL